MEERIGPSIRILAYHLRSIERQKPGENLTLGLPSGDSFLITCESAQFESQWNQFYFHQSGNKIGVGNRNGASDYYAKMWIKSWKETFEGFPE